MVSMRRTLEEPPGSFLTKEYSAAPLLCLAAVWDAVPGCREGFRLFAGAGLSALKYRSIVVPHPLGEENADCATGTG